MDPFYVWSCWFLIHFKTSYHLLYMFRRRLQHCFSVKLWNFTRLSISMRLKTEFSVLGELRDTLFWQIIGCLYPSPRRTLSLMHNTTHIIYACRSWLRMWNLSTCFWIFRRAPLKGGPTSVSHRVAVCFFSMRAGRKWDCFCMYDKWGDRRRKKSEEEEQEEEEEEDKRRYIQRRRERDCGKNTSPLGLN